MKAGLATLMVAATLAIPQLVSAAEAPATISAAQAAPSDVSDRMILVRRYFTAIQFDKLMDQMLESQLDVTISQGQIPGDKRAIFREAALAAYAVVIPRMVEESMQMYADAFTQDELEQLVAFYESPVGRSMTSKTVLLTQNTGEIMQRYSPQMEQEVMRQLCSRIDCEAEGLSR